MKLHDIPFAINGTTGMLTLNKKLDRENVSHYRLLITARDLDFVPRKSYKMVC